MKFTHLQKLHLDELTCLFIQTSGNRLLLQPSEGDGSAEIFRPETGLQVSIWTCRFFDGVELYKPALPDEVSNDFTIAYFLGPQNPGFPDTHGNFQRGVPRNCVFFSAASGFGMSLAPMALCRCVSISFSRKWLLNVLQTNNTLYQLGEQIIKTGKFEAFRRMTPEERSTLEELIQGAEKNHFRAFYTKAVALQVVGDFLFRLKEEQLFLSRNALQNTLKEVRQWLCEHITKEFSGTRALAKKFSISESTLKRHFRKKFGVTISAYITSKKMQYANSLVGEQGMTIAQASRITGYRSVQNFKKVFNSYVDNQNAGAALNLDTH